MGGRLGLAIGIIAIVAFILVAIELFGGSYIPDDADDLNSVDNEFNDALSGFYNELYNKREWR